MANNNLSTRVHTLTEGAIMVALATVLSFLKLWKSPYGGSVTVLSMAPIIIFSMRRGVRAGLLAGFAHALIQLLFDLGTVAYVPTPMGIMLCVLLDYILPFTLLGLGGLFRNVQFTKNRYTNLIIAAALGALLVTVLRYLCHIFSGVVIWYELDLEWYAEDPDHIVNRYGSWAFSAIYNGIFMIPEIIATVIGAPLLTRALANVKE